MPQLPFVHLHSQRIARIVTNFSATPESAAPVSDSLPPAQVATVVLQPRCRLDQAAIASFRMVLEQALHQASQAVIVDLIWVEAIDAVGVELLRLSLHLAHRLGKVLLFQSIDRGTRAVLDAERARLRTASLGSWAEVWQESFHQFLGDRQQTRSAVDCLADGTQAVSSKAPAGKKLRVRRIELEQSFETRVAVSLQ